MKQATEEMAKIAVENTFEWANRTHPFKSHLAMAEAMNVIENYIYKVILESSARANTHYLGFRKELSREEKLELFKTRSSEISEMIMERVDNRLDDCLETDLCEMADEFVL